MNKRRIFFLFVGFVVLLFVGAQIYRFERKSEGSERRDLLLRSLEAESAHVDSWIQRCRRVAKDWLSDQQTRGFQDLGVEAVRFYKGGELRRQWRSEGSPDLVFDLEEPLLIFKESHLMQMDRKYIAMTWSMNEDEKIFFLIQQKRFLPLRETESGISFALVNTTEQLIAFSGRELSFEIFRPGVDYGRTPPETPEVQQFDGEIVAWRSLPDLPSVYLIARIPN